ncbi:hypothetical protein [Streptomyces sp. C]|uniref:hypothetical protein n=1 Tax=Streptomyces sp. C TaxID=253839 RepID=UPI0001B58186|nr:hypothetical protein [Streptomyces sp. C]
MLHSLALLSTSLISVHQAATLTGTSGPTARCLLDVLVHAHLMERVSPHYYRFHGFIGIYAAECAQREPQADRDLMLATG